MSKPITMNMDAMDTAINTLNGLASFCIDNEIANKTGSGAAVDETQAIQKAYNKMSEQMQTLLTSTAKFLKKAKASYKKSDDKASWQFKG
ncbi:hypothetical protein OZX72_00125 [Bifidobacterium sp. ESL0769]|uniref:hypothetical protein n=1 Tax=Bifidobacterium sp. ESL0769 TaxID=2983229 RepID=UPI0023F97499|nr:hypothetical protein [Bifidobacterium sp. ESL0769]WEV67462.1 hypothetical protein OZX72_00125 [Bifidobacterium sp. ESL0769]